MSVAFEFVFYRKSSLSVGWTLVSEQTLTHGKMNLGQDSKTRVIWYHPAKPSNFGGTPQLSIAVEHHHLGFSVPFTGNSNLDPSQVIHPFLTWGCNGQPVPHPPLDSTRRDQTV